MSMFLKDNWGETGTVFTVMDNVTREVGEALRRRTVMNAAGVREERMSDLRGPFRVNNPGKSVFTFAWWTDDPRDGGTETRFKVTVEPV